MDTGPPYLFMEDPGSTPAELLGFQNFHDFGARDLQPQAVSSQAAQRPFYNDDRPSGFAPGHGPFTTNAYRAPSAGGTSSLPMSMPGVAPPAPSSTSAIPESGNALFPHNVPGEPLNTVDYPRDQLMGFGNQWRDFSNAGLQRRPFVHPQQAPRPSLSHPAGVSGRPQPFYANQAQPLQPLGSQQYQFMTQAPINTPVQANSQHVPNAGTSSIYPPSFRQTSYTQSQSRQAGVTPGISQRRRNNRNQSFAGGSPSSLHSRAGSQGTRRRSRPASERSSQAAATLSPTRNQRPEAAQPNSSSPASSESYPMLTAQQRVQIARGLQLNSLQLGDLLRMMDADDVRDLQMYEESLLRRRYRHELDTHESPPPPSKGLDNQNDGRPEPKDAEEMTVNLECRICMSQTVDTVMLPCGHAVLCRWCAEQHLSPGRADRTRPKGYGLCPMCRAPVKQKFRIYFS